MKNRAPRPAPPARRLIGLAGAAALVAAATGFAGFAVAASETLLHGTGLTHAFPPPSTVAGLLARAGQWWSYQGLDPAQLAAWSPAQVESLHRWLQRGMVAGFVGAAAGAAGPLAVASACMRRAWRERRPAEPVERGTSDNHGHADWMSLEEALVLFPGPHGVAVGEAARMDRSPVARLPFNPQDRRTWGEGGRAPLLVDPGTEGAGHFIVIAGSGGFKTQSAMTSFHTFSTGIFAFDPSCELADVVREMREERGRRVVVLDPAGRTGFNALAWIDIRHPLAEVNVRAEAERIYGRTEARGKDEASAEFFRSQGKNLVLAFLAHMLWSPDVAPQHKTLRALRQGLTRPAQEVRDILRHIHEASPSPLARQLASNYGLVEQTFDGILSNAQEATAWLSVNAYADMVSGDAFRAADLACGDVDVICQIPLKAMLSQPEIGRVVLGAHLNAIFEREGQAQRTLFLIDEAVLFGAMRELKVARDQGRKYRITLGLHYQSEGQIAEAWGREGREAWFDGVSWRAYGAIQSLETARGLSAALGTYAAMATSKGANKGTSGHLWGKKSHSKGGNTNEHEISRELMKPAELLQDMRTDERIVLFRGRMPLRCRAPIAFCREEVRRRLGTNRYAPSGGG